MTITKIRKVGNSLGVLLPASALNQLKLAEGDSVSVLVVDGALSVRPISLKTERLMTRSEGLLRRHRDALIGIGND